MIYIIFAVVIVVSAFFLILPFMQGKSVVLQEDLQATQNKNAGEIEKLKDHIESLKLALRDLDQENKIGKIDPDDFEAVKNELLTDWKNSEDNLKKLTS